MGVASKVVATTEVGRPETLSEKHAIVSSFHAFESLPHEKGQCTYSPEMACHGHMWRIQVFPGGRKECEGGPWTSLFLRYEGDGKVKAMFSIRIPSKVKDFNSKAFTFGKSIGHGAWGWHEFILREDLLNPAKGHLVNGSLTVRVGIRVLTETPAVFIPRKRMRLDMLELLESGNEGDTCFIVDGKSFVVIQALISRRAPVLGEIGASEKPGTDIVLQDVWTRPPLRRFFALSTRTSLLRTWTTPVKY